MRVKQFTISLDLSLEIYLRAIEDSAYYLIYLAGTRLNALKEIQATQTE